MHDLPRLARVLAALLPAATAERCFVPTCWDLHARHVRATRRAAPWTRTLRYAALAAQIVAAAIECAILASREHRHTRLAEPPRRGVDPMLTQDVRFAFRMLRRNPGFAAIAIVALALGIGANTAIFSIVYAVLLRPLPYGDPSRIVEIRETSRGRLTTVSPPNFVDWKMQSRSFEHMSAYNDATATLTVGEEPEQIPAAVVGAEFFDVLGVKPILGRGFLPVEERPGGPQVAVLGYALWQRRFGGDPTLVGRTVTFDSVSYEVVGVMPREFRFPEDVGLWFPLVFTAGDIAANQRGAHYIGAIGRLKPGVTVAQAIDDLAAIEQSIARQFPEKVAGYGIWARPIFEAIVGDVRRPLLMILGAVAFVLLIACVNVSNLLLARSSTRRAEIALRSALGAGRWRIVRQLLAESVLLSLAGGVAGVLLATWGVRVLSTLLPQDLPRAENVGVNLSVLLFSLAVSVLTGVLFGVVPAIYAASPDLAAFLKDARRDGTPTGRRSLRSMLVVGEVALSLVLLAGAGLAIRSFDRLSAVTPGFDPEGLLSVNVVAPESRYPDSAALARFYRDYTQALAAQPGVVAAGAVSSPPLARGGFGGTFTIVGRNDDDNQNMQVRCVTPGYFEALRIPLRRGRLLTAQDAEHAAPVAIITEESARRYWPGNDPIGKRIRIHVSMGTREPEREIVGVVGDVKTRALDEAAPPVVYTPHAQYPSDAMTVFVRTTGDPQALLPGVKAQLATIDRDLAITRVRTGTQLVAASIAQPRFRMILLALFAAMALALAAVGLYGVMAYSVSQRRTELGMRMALGADAGSLLCLVLRQGMTPVALGLAIGLPAAALLTQVMSGQLYEIETFDPLTFVGVAALLAGVAMAACYLPARRAIALDPLAAIRQE